MAKNRLLPCVPIKRLADLELSQALNCIRQPRRIQSRRSGSKVATSCGQFLDEINYINYAHACAMMMAQKGSRASLKTTSRILKTTIRIPHSPYALSRTIPSCNDQPNQAEGQGPIDCSVHISYSQSKCNFQSPVGGRHWSSSLPTSPSLLFWSFTTCRVRQDMPSARWDIVNRSRQL